MFVCMQNPSGKYTIRRLSSEEERFALAPSETSSSCFSGLCGTILNRARVSLYCQNEEDEIVLDNHLSRNKEEMEMIRNKSHFSTLCFLHVCSESHPNVYTLLCIQYKQGCRGK